MKLASLAAAAAVVLSAGRLCALEIHGSNEFSFAYANITGTGRASSSLTQGWRYLDVLNLNTAGKYAGWDYNLSVGGKATDDRRNDPVNFSMTTLSGKVTNGEHTLGAGDVFENFSQYTMNTSLKGFSYKFAKQGARLPEATLIYGAAYPRWDNFYGDSRTATAKRNGFGARLKFSPFEELAVGGNAVLSRDTKRVNPTDTLTDNNNYSIDYEWKPIGGLSVTGESSWANNNNYAGGGAAGVTQNGAAHRIEVVGDGGPSRVTLEGERVGTNYATTLGAATADRLKGKAKWRYKVNRDLSLNTGMLWFRNNLRGQLGFTTNTYKPEIGATLKRVFGRQYSSADLSYKYDRKTAGPTNSGDHYINLNYKDRFAGIDTDTNAGFTTYNTFPNTRSAREFLLNTTLSGRKTMGSAILKPQLSGGFWRSRDELALTTDKQYEYAAGLGLELPESNVTTDIRAGQNLLQKQVGDNSFKFFANWNIYYRPQSLKQFGEVMLFARAFLNDFAYTTSAKNFRESGVTLGLNTSF